MKNLFIIFTVIFNINAFGMDQVFINEYKSFKQAALQSNTLSKKQKYLLNNIQIKDDTKKQLNESLIGECKPEIHTVIINKEKFINLPYFFKQEIIDHELGHCIIQRSHNNTVTQIGFLILPDSIMHFQTFAYASTTDMEIKRKELFNKNFYGTINDLKKSLGGEFSFMQLRILENKVMMDRIEKYKKKYLP